MRITLTFPPDIEAGLLAQAATRGLPIDRYLESVIEQIVPSSSSSLPGDQWTTELDALSNDAPVAPLLSDEAVSRESFYCRDDR